MIFVPSPVDPEGQDPQAEGLLQFPVIRRVQQHGARGARTQELSATGAVFKGLV